MITFKKKLIPLPEPVEEVPVFTPSEAPKRKVPTLKAKKSAPSLEVSKYDFILLKYNSDYRHLAKDTLSSLSSNVQGSKVRILEAYKEYGGNKNKFMEFLKKEYSLSGNTTPYGHVSYRGHGMMLSVYEVGTSNKTITDVHFTWSEVTDMILELLKDKSYFNPALPL